MTMLNFLFICLWKIYEEGKLLVVVIGAVWSEEKGSGS